MFKKRQTVLLDMHHAMLDALGPSRQWQTTSPFAVAVAAILAQNTTWDNATKAMINLERAGGMTPEALHGLPATALADLIRPAGAFRVKAARLRNLQESLLDSFGGDITALAALPMDVARDRLLTIKGIGPETADTILLYALGFPSFVVDTFTARICQRHGLVPEDVDYGDLRDYFMDALPEDVALFRDLHLLLVRVGSRWCRARSPNCQPCPLAGFLP